MLLLVLIKTPVDTENVMPMEQLPINNNGGQGYGFILYEKELDTIPREITIHNISDRAQVLRKSLNHGLYSSLCMHACTIGNPCKGIAVVITLVCFH